MPKKGDKKQTTKGASRDLKKIQAAHAAMQLARDADRRARIARNSAKQKEDAAKARKALEQKIRELACSDADLIDELFGNQGVVEMKQREEEDPFKVQSKKKKTVTKFHRDFTLLRGKGTRSRAHHYKKQKEVSTEAFPTMEVPKLTPAEQAMQAKLQAEFDKRAREAHERMKKRREAMALAKAKKDTKFTRRQARACNHGAKCFRILTDCKFSHTDEEKEEAKARFQGTIAWASGNIEAFADRFEVWANRIGEASPSSISGALKSLLAKASDVHGKMNRALKNLGLETCNEEQEANATIAHMTELLDATMEKLSKEAKASKTSKPKTKSSKKPSKHSGMDFSLGDQVERILEARRKAASQDDH